MLKCQRSFWLKSKGQLFCTLPVMWFICDTHLSFCDVCFPFIHGDYQVFIRKLKASFCIRFVVCKPINMNNRAGEKWKLFLSVTAASNLRCSCFHLPFNETSDHLKKSYFREAMLIVHVELYPVFWYEQRFGCQNKAGLCCILRTKDTFWNNIFVKWETQCKAKPYLARLFLHMIYHIRIAKYVKSSHFATS